MILGYLGDYFKLKCLMIGRVVCYRLPYHW